MAKGKKFVLIILFLVAIGLVIAVYSIFLHKGLSYQDMQFGDLMKLYWDALEECFNGLKNHVNSKAPLVMVIGVVVFILMFIDALVQIFVSRKYWYLIPSAVLSVFGLFTFLLATMVVDGQIVEYSTSGFVIQTLLGEELKACYVLGFASAGLSVLVFTDMTIVFRSRK